MGSAARLRLLPGSRGGAGHTTWDADERLGVAVGLRDDSGAIVDLDHPVHQNPSVGHLHDYGVWEYVGFGRRLLATMESGEMGCGPEEGEFDRDHHAR